MPWGGIGNAVGSIAGGLLSNAFRKDNSAELAQMNYEHQKEFAQNGIRWKVADAKAAGIHPLAALGATTTSFTPGYVGGESSGQDYSWLADAGQGIGRAVEAGLSRKERADMQAKREQAADLDMQTRQAQLEGVQLDNQARKLDMVRQMAQDAERAVIHQNQGPGIPTRADGAIIDGQADALGSGRFSVKPAEITANAPGAPAIEAGSVPEISFTRTATGGYAPTMSRDAKDRLEDDMIGEANWHVRNRLGSFDSDMRYAPPFSPGKGNRWIFDNIRGEWVSIPRNASIFRKLGTALGLLGR